MSYDSYSNRTASWGEEAPSANRSRRSAPRSAPNSRTVRRNNSATAFADDDLNDLLDDEEERSGWRDSLTTFSRTWWRPKSRTGRILLGIGVVIVLSSLGFAYYKIHAFLLHDTRFRLPGTASIEAVGNSQVTRADLLPVFGEDVGHNIFLVPLTERRKQIEEIPWVKQATVMRLLPDQLRVNLIERTPIAFVREGQQIELADADGVLLHMNPAMMAQKHYSFPVITGIRSGDAPEDRSKRMAVYQRFIAELDANGQRLSQQISEIDLANPDDVRVTMPEQGADIAAHFGDDHFLERYNNYKTHIAEWRQQYPRLTGVDLRYDQQVVLKMADGGNLAAQTTTAAAKAAEETSKAVARRTAAKSATHAASHRGAKHPAPKKNAPDIRHKKHESANAAVATKHKPVVAVKQGD